MTHLPVEQLPKSGDRDLLAISIRGCSADVDCHAKEIGDRDSWYRYRILESQEEAHARPFVGSQSHDILALEEHLALGNLIRRVTHQDIGQGGFSCTIGSHQGVNLPLRYGEVDALEDLLPLNRGVEILDF